jgi:hypothetical protein
VTHYKTMDGVQDVSRIDPDNWLHDQVLLDRPGNRDIQLDLFHDYGTNVPLYPQFQAFFRQYKPPTLIVWGRNDKIFPPDGVENFLQGLGPKAADHVEPWLAPCRSLGPPPSLVFTKPMVTPFRYLISLPLWLTWRARDQRVSNCRSRKPRMSGAISSSLSSSAKCPVSSR